MGQHAEATQKSRGDALAINCIFDCSEKTIKRSRRRLLGALCLMAGLGVSSAAAQVDNILNNGGFEYALMCYGDWIWSKTGQDYKGDYEFSLSSDAHSGSYSAEIRCVGADCEKAAILSEKIYTPPNQAYKLSLYSKCPAGRKAAVYVPATAKGDILQDLVCRDEWAPNTIRFKTAPSASNFRFYIYNRDVEWLRVDDVVLTYEDGSVPRQKPMLHAGARNVGTNGAYFTVDGNPYLALGFFFVGYDDLRRAAEFGANTVIPETTPQCFNTEQGSYSERAYELGLGVVQDSTPSARLRSPEVFPAIMKRFAPHLSNVAWYLVDEPDQKNVSWYYVTGTGLEAEYSGAKSQTNLPMMVDFQRAAWSNLAEVMPYRSSTDVWMAEPYGADFRAVNHAIGIFNSLRSRPIWLAQDGVDASLVVPKAYWAVISGATGILYFTWDDFNKDAEKSRAVREVFAELKQLKDVLFGQNIDRQVTFKADAATTQAATARLYAEFAQLKGAISGKDVGKDIAQQPEQIAYIARQYQGATYILAANQTTQRVEGTFSAPGLGAGKQVAVLFENRSLSAIGGKFTDTFDGISRHVYRIQ